MKPLNSPPSDAEVATTPAWRRLWSMGAVDTFGSPLSALIAPDGTNSPPLVSHWRRWVRDLPERGELLDVGSGNGVMLVHLLVAKPESALRAIGVDLAQPSLGWLETFNPTQRERIEFHNDISAEKLPFVSGRFVASTSQFGIEYADMSRAVPEVIRVLGPGAAIGWVLHHDSGRPARLAREELDHLSWFECQGWFESAAKVVAAPVPLGVGNSPAWLHFETLVRALQKREAASSCPDVLRDVVGWTNQCFVVTQKHGAGRGLSVLQQMRQLLMDIRTRLLDLTNHTLDESAWADLLGRLHALGVTTRPGTGPLIDRGHLMGWWVDGRLN